MSALKIISITSKSLKSIRVHKWASSTWAGALVVTLLAGSAAITQMSVVEQYKKMSGNAETAMKNDGAPTITSKNGQKIDVSPYDNKKITNDPVGRRALLSTLMIQVKNGGRHYVLGSAVVLSGFRVNGLPVLATIRHVMDANQRIIPDGKIYALDHNGLPIGTIMSFPQQGYGTIDYPTLAYFDDPSAISADARKELLDIHGVEIARNLPPGMLIGPSTNNVFTGGASGGGWVNEKGQLIGIINGVVISPVDKLYTASTIDDSPLNEQLSNTNDTLMGTEEIQSLAVGPMLQQLWNLASTDQPHSEGLTSESSGFGFGFPSGREMFFQGQLTYSKIVSDQATAALSAELAKEIGAPYPD